MDSKLSLVVVAVVVVLCCDFIASVPIAYNQPHVSKKSPDTLDHMARYLEFFEPLAISKREAPVYESEENKKDDLKSSASGYGYGHGGGGHGSNSPTGYVSYGAKTGGYGAFSWYSDHPAGTYGYH